MEYLVKAKIINTLSKDGFNNSDKVLSGVMAILSIKGGSPAKEIIYNLTGRLNMSPSLLRKIICELKKDNILVQEGSLYKLNETFKSYL